MTRHAEVDRSPTSSSAAIPALAALAGMIGDPAVRNRGTIGGSIANNDPAADYPGGARRARRDSRAPTSARSPADDFFTGMFETALEPGRDRHRGQLPASRRPLLPEVPQPGLALRHRRRLRRQAPPAACASP